MPSERFNFCPDKVTDSGARPLLRRKEIAVEIRPEQTCSIFKIFSET